MDRPTAHQLYLESGPLIDEVIRLACARFRLSREDAQDFGQEVHLMLVQKDYRVFRDWPQNCELTRYLAVVVLRFGRDYMGRIPGRFDLSLPPHQLPPDQLFAKSLPLLDEVIRFTSYHFRLSPEDAEDFGQEVRLKLMQEDYRVLRAWKRESRLRSYLAAVILNFGRDYMDHLMGKYRPSAKAIELGKEAVWLETLLVRDGLDYDHAKWVLRSVHGVALSDAELDGLREQLPPRTRPQPQDVEVLEKHAAPGSNPEQGLLAKQAAERRRAVYPMLACAMKDKSAREQMLLKLFFFEGLTVAEIARAWKEAQKPLYRELERIVRGLRKHLGEKGIRRADLKDLLPGTAEDQDEDGQPGGVSLCN